MRGLKRLLPTIDARTLKSHLLQMRGLKLLNREGHRTGRQVASFTDAWIETQAGLATCFGNSVASFTDAWIETPMNLWACKKAYVASFTDAWIETN